MANIYEEKLSFPNGTLTDTPAWYGHVDNYKWGQWVDEAFLLLLGGIPWQCYYQVS